MIGTILFIKKVNAQIYFVNIKTYNQQAQQLNYQLTPNYVHILMTPVLLLINCIFTAFLITN